MSSTLGKIFRKKERGRRGKEEPVCHYHEYAGTSLHSSVKDTIPAVYYQRKEVACGSRDIRDIFSACAVWFTFISRTPTPRAVEDFIVKGLPVPDGTCHSASALLPSFTSLLYHKSCDLSRGIFNFFLKTKPLLLSAPFGLGDGITSP